MPPARSGPPFLMTEMIQAEPAFAARLLRRLLAEGSAADRLAQAARSTVAAGRDVVIVGCGTSEHGAMVAATILASGGSLDVGQGTGRRPAGARGGPGAAGRGPARGHQP